MTHADDGITVKPELLKRMTEAEFQQKVIDYAHWNHWLVAHFRPAQTGKGWRTPMQGDPGFLDLVLARRGVVIFAELKREGKDPTPAQVRWISAIGAKARVWRPSDWPTIQEELK